MQLLDTNFEKRKEVLQIDDAEKWQELLFQQPMVIYKQHRNATILRQGYQCLLTLQVAKLEKR